MLSTITRTRTRRLTAAALAAAGESRLKLRGGGRFDLKLRVPSWTTEFAVEVNGRDQEIDAAPGEYATIGRRWRSGDTVDVSMPLRLHTEAALDDPGIQSVYYGPTLLAIQHEPWATTSSPDCSTSASVRTWRRPSSRPASPSTSPPTATPSRRSTSGTTPRTTSTGGGASRPPNPFDPYP